MLFRSLIVYRLYGYGHSDLGRGIAAEKRGDAPPPEPVFHEGPEA